MLVNCCCFIIINIIIIHSFRKFLQQHSRFLLRGAPDPTLAKIISSIVTITFSGAILLRMICDSKHRECQDTYHCRSSPISRAKANRIFQCNGSTYPTDHASWVRMKLSVKQLINSGVLLVSGWPVPQIANLSSWIETHVTDQKSFNVTFSSPPRLLKYLEIASTDHQVAFRVPRDSSKHSILQTDQLW